MKTRTFLLFMTMLLSVSMCGCGKNSQKKETMTTSTEPESALASDSGDVSLLVWGAEEDEALLKQIIKSFETEYQGQADFNIIFAPQGESGCTNTLMGGLEEGADVFAFADDQLNTLVAAGALEPVENADAVKSEHLEGAVEAASVGNTLYAYPLTADNGYFMYYNKKYFTKKDIRTLDRILDIAGEHNKKFAMDWSSAWYVYSFFGNTGLEVGLTENGITNFCTWNKKRGAVKGTDVAKAMLSIAKQPGFLSATDSDFLAGVQDGSVIAGVSGVWNAVAVEKAWGKHYAAAKLPTYTCKGQQIQMSSFSGYKLIGVNAYSKHYAWASKLAEWITKEENQQLRFQMRGQGPSNIKAAKSVDVQNSPAITALLEQSEFSCLQRIGGNYWEPVAVFSGNMAAGNPSGEDLQKQLDRMVEGITA